MLQRLLNSIRTSPQTQVAMTGLGLTVLATAAVLLKRFLNGAAGLPVVVISLVMVLLLNFLVLFKVFCVQDGGWSEAKKRDLGCSIYAWVEAVLALVTGVIAMSFLFA